jgi:hypothetical protein
MFTAQTVLPEQFLNQSSVNGAPSELDDNYFVIDVKASVAENCK